MLNRRDTATATFPLPFIQLPPLAPSQSFNLSPFAVSVSHSHPDWTLALPPIRTILPQHCQASSTPLSTPNHTPNPTPLPTPIHSPQSPNWTFDLNLHQFGAHPPLPDLRRQASHSPDSMKRKEPTSDPETSLKKRAKKSQEPVIDNNQDLTAILEDAEDVTQAIFPSEEQIYSTKVVFFEGYIVAVVNQESRLRRPEIRDGSKRPSTQHNDKLRGRGFTEKRLAKKEKEGRTFFMKKASDEDLKAIEKILPRSPRSSSTQVA